MKLSSIEEYDHFILDFFENKSNHDLLDLAFRNTLDSTTFQKSGFRPHQLVGLNIWISKYSAFFLYF